jgi:hypothetical protein
LGKKISEVGEGTGRDAYQMLAMMMEPMILDLYRDRSKRTERSMDRFGDLIPLRLKSGILIRVGPYGKGTRIQPLRARRRKKREQDKRARQIAAPLLRTDSSAMGNPHDEYNNQEMKRA